MNASVDPQACSLGSLTARSNHENNEVSEHPYAYLLPHIFNNGESILADQERLISSLRLDLSKA